MFVAYITRSKGGSFAQVCPIDDDGIAADRSVTHGGVRTGDAGNAGDRDARGRSARRGHYLGDRGGFPGALHAGRLRDAGGRFLSDEERRECGGQDSGDDGHRACRVLGGRLRVRLLRGWRAPIYYWYPRLLPDRVG